MRFRSVSYTHLDVYKRQALPGAGLWGVEFFLSHENGVYFSELSPRPHDTGMVTSVPLVASKQLKKLSSNTK